jgi:IclR family transcriptional regulator, KDG regulon repressor
VRVHDEKASQLKTLSLALQVLECFDVQRPERGVTDLANALGVSKATVFRVLATLQRYDYIRQNPATGRYGLGRRLREIGALSDTRWNLAQEVQPYMEELHEQTGEAIHLVVLDGDEAVNIATVAGPHKVELSLRSGTRLPAHAVAVGKAILAYAMPEQLYELLGRGVAKYTRHTLTERALERQLAHIRYVGYAVNTGELHPEGYGIAVPVVDTSGTACAAIGICGQATRLTESYIADRIPLMVSAATRLSADLAARRPEPLANPGVQRARRRAADRAPANLV